MNDIFWTVITTMMIVLGLIFMLVLGLIFLFKNQIQATIEACMDFGDPEDECDIMD